MKKQYVTLLFTLICVVGLELSAQAQEKDILVTNVPFDFVVAGHVLPAGNYRVSRVHPLSGSRELEISSYETRARAFLIPTVFDDVETGDAQLSFAHVEDKHFLSGIKTQIGTYGITVPPSAIKLARTERESAFSSGSN